MTVVAAGKLRRGVDLELGVQALANADVSFGKFLSAELAGQAQASASVSAQIQAPMNLFDEIGFAVRLQAIAELAAAVQLSLGLKMGDFLALADQDPNTHGLPVELLRVFLSEVDIKAGFYAKAALTAQAYAHLVITGTAIANSARNIKPGFNVVAGIGAGLKAGAGFRVFANMQFKDFSRFVARSVDRLVDGACDQAATFLPASQADVLRALGAARPLSKIALRTAYELGEFIATQAPAANADGSQAVALRCSQVMLEEGQRAILKGMTDAALDGLEALVRSRLDSVTQNKWSSTQPQRAALANHLRQFPDEPFDGTPTTETYWTILGSRVADLVAALAGPTVDAPTKRLVSILWAAAQLALIAARRLIRADASLKIIGLPPRQAKASFSGGLIADPPPLVRDHILASLAVPPPNNKLRLEDLVEFLCADAALDFLRQHNPGLDTFLSPLSGPLGGAANDVARAILRNIASIVADSGGQPDAQATLATFTSGLRSLARQELEQRLAPALDANLAARPDLKTYFDEVFFPCIEFTLDVVLDMIARWPQVGGDQDLLKEALSGVLMKVVGRSLVVTTDIMLASAQQQIQGLLNGLADQVDAPDGIVAVLSKQSNLPVDASEIAELTADALRIGADVLGPLSDTQRATIRSLMYEVIDPLPAGADGSFLSQLADQAFIPNADKMTALAQELAELGGERFLMFVEKLLDLIGRKVLTELGDVLAAAGQMVAQWFADAQQTLANIGRQLAQVLADIERLGEEVAAAFDQAVDKLLGALSTLATQSGRRKFKTALADQVVGDVLAVLNGNFVYASLVPSGMKSAVRTMARDALEAALDAGVVDDVLGVIGGVADQVDDLIDDVRDLDPSHDLTEQLGNLLLNRLTSAIYDGFGGNPHVDIRFDVGIGPFTQHIELGRIEIPVEAMVDGLRNTIRDLDLVETALRDAAQKVAAAFAKEAQLHAATEQKTALQGTQSTLDRQMRALEVAPRSVRILSPAIGSVMSADGRLRIEIQGLNADAAGSESGRPQAIHVYVNQQELALSRFTVTEIGTSRTAATVDAPAQALTRFTLLSGTPLRPQPAAASQMRSLQQPLRVPARPTVTIASAGRTTRSGRFALTPAGARVFGGNGKTLPRKGDRRLGAPLPVTQIGRLIETTESGIILQCTLTAADLEAGINVVSVSVTPPRGNRVEASATFIADAGSKAAQPKPGEARLPIPGGKPAKPFTPKNVAGKFLLSPKQQRLQRVQQQKQVLSRRATEQRAAMLDAVPVLVRPPIEPVPPRRDIPTL